MLTASSSTTSISPTPNQKNGTGVRVSSEKWGLRALLLATFIAYTWGLDQNGWGNPFYAATAQAGANDWTAFFFGSQDWNNVITVDKPPLALWPVALSIRIFGLSSWSVLVPQALMGTATVWLLYLAVRRVFPAAVAFSAAVLSCTAPVFLLMSRFNNPEPMMGLLIGLGLYCTVRAAENGRWRWYMLMGIFFGLSFLAKQFQGLVPVLAIGLTLVLFGPDSIGQRIRRLGAATVAMVVAGGWWVAIVELTPAASRPYVGGSVTNSIVELTLDYNGLARLLQFPIAENGGPATGGVDVEPYDGGISRLFNGNFAPEIGWLLATAIASVVIVTVYGRSLFQGRLERAFALVACGWFLSAWLLISFMGTMVHSYYSYSIVEPMALVISLALKAAWLRSNVLIGRLFGVFLLAATAYMTVRTMEYSDAWRWWGPIIVIALALLASGLWLLKGPRVPSAAIWTVTLLSLAAGQLGTDAFTVMSTVQGTQPLSGPISNNPNAMSRHLQDIRTTGQPDWAPHVAFGVAPSPQMLAVFGAEGSGTGKWLAATYPAQDAALTQLATRRAILSLGGWLGLDPAPTLDQFKTWVLNGDIEFFVDHPAMHSYGLGKQAEAISEWVQRSYMGEKVNDAVIYRLDNAHEK